MAPWQMVALSMTCGALLFLGTFTVALHFGASDAASEPAATPGRYIAIPSADPDGLRVLDSATGMVRICRGDAARVDCGAGGPT